MSVKVEKRFMSINEAADYLGLARITLYRWTETGKMPSVKMGSRRVIETAALESWLAQNGATGGVV